MTDTAIESFLVPPRGRGVLAAAATLILLWAAIIWLRHDLRYEGAIQLSAAVRIILADAALEPAAKDIFQSGADGLTSVLDPFSAFIDRKSVV